MLGDWTREAGHPYTRASADALGVPARKLRRCAESPRPRAPHSPGRLQGGKEDDITVVAAVVADGAQAGTLAQVQRALEAAAANTASIPSAVGDATMEKREARWRPAIRSACYLLSPL